LNSVTIIQARTNSARFPAKALLPINGVPMALLAALRASNSGRHVIVATSTESSDDALFNMLSSQGIHCFRGSLNNTLNRFTSALRDYDDETIVTRLTADNVFPDGMFLDQIEAMFVAQSLSYLTSTGEGTGLPYGMSAEVMRLKHLRAAEKEAVSNYDREHVTPHIARSFGRTVFSKYSLLDSEKYLCTIDSLDDYLAILAVVENFSDIINESFLSLIDSLKGRPHQPFVTALASRLILGTAQFGDQYGIANITGSPDGNQIEKIVKQAIFNGVEFIDTARGYGASEEKVGKALSGGLRNRVKLISKLASLDGCPKDASEGEVRAFVDASFFQSCTFLNTQKIDVYLLHRADHLTKFNGAVWKRLLELKNLGLIGLLGVSIQSPDELAIALEFEEVNLIQLPNNLLDWRWDSMIPHIERVKHLRDLTIHVRSVLLQGLVLTKGPELWKRAHVYSSDAIVSWLEQKVVAFGRESIVDLCISYIDALPWVDGIVVGMENLKQLDMNLLNFGNAGLSDQQIAAIQLERPLLEEKTLNPALWSSPST